MSINKYENYEILSNQGKSNNRSAKKSIYKNNFFDISINSKTNEILLDKTNIIYSFIPYDNCRKYMEMALIKYISNEKWCKDYLNKHKNNIKKYISLALYQESKIKANDLQINEEFNKIFEDDFLKIQVIGRLLQNDTTGPLSASLNLKFLSSNMKMNGISQYLYQYVKLVLELWNKIDSNKLKDDPKLLTFNNSFQNELVSINDLAIKIPNFLENTNEDNKLPFTSKENKDFAKSLRKNYVAHSINPDLLKNINFFENVLDEQNENEINVISDIHAHNKIPFSNSNFNIFAGDVIDNYFTNKDIKGIYVIGNHELSTVVKYKYDLFHKFHKYTWFQELYRNPDDAWQLIPLGKHKFYKYIKNELENMFPNMNVLNNDITHHDGIRYVGLTIPVRNIERKKKLFKFIRKELEHLLGKDRHTPTVIISHAPICNELSMLKPSSSSYNKNYNCDDEKLINIFNEYNIVSVIHGHHHIPASNGTNEIVKFGPNKILLICSIYSNINTGIDLSFLLSNFMIKKNK